VEIEWNKTSWIVVESNTFNLLDDGDLAGTLKLKHSPSDIDTTGAAGILRGRVAGDPFRAEVWIQWGKSSGWVTFITATVAGHLLQLQAWPPGGQRVHAPDSAAPISS